MKSKKFLIIVSLTATLATAQIVGLPNQKSKEAQAQSSSRSIDFQVLVRPLLEMQHGEPVHQAQG
jgi:hypothetical protein